MGKALATTTLTPTNSTDESPAMPVLSRQAAEGDNFEITVNTKNESDRIAFSPSRNNVR